MLRVGHDSWFVCVSLPPFLYPTLAVYQLLSFCSSASAPTRVCSRSPVSPLLVSVSLFLFLFYSLCVFPYFSLSVLKPLFMGLRVRQSGFSIVYSSNCLQVCLPTRSPTYLSVYVCRPDNPAGWMRRWIALSQQGVTTKKASIEGSRAIVRAFLRRRLLEPTTPSATNYSQTCVQGAWGALIICFVYIHTNVGEEEKSSTGQHD